jgi:hypothetical protein
MKLYTAGRHLNPRDGFRRSWLELNTAENVEAVFEEGFKWYPCQKLRSSSRRTKYGFVKCPENVRLPEYWNTILGDV